MTDKEHYSNEFYGLYGDKALLVLKTPLGFSDLKPGDLIHISSGGLVGEHIYDEGSYVDIIHEPGLPMIIPGSELKKFFPKDFPSEDKYYQEIESRKFLGKTNWMLYSMYEAIKDKDVVFLEKTKANALLFMCFVEQFFEEED